MREILSKFMDQIKELIMVLMTFFVLILTSMVVSFFIEVFIESQRTKLEQKMGDTGILIGHGEILMVSYVACIIMILSLYGAKILLEEYFIKAKIKGSAGDFKNALNRADRMAKTSVKNTKEASKKAANAVDDKVFAGAGKNKLAEREYERDKKIQERKQRARAGEGNFLDKLYTIGDTRKINEENRKTINQSRQNLENFDKTQLESIAADNMANGKSTIVGGIGGATINGVKKVKKATLNKASEIVERNYGDTQLGQKINSKIEKLNEEKEGINFFEEDKDINKLSQDMRNEIEINKNGRNGAINKTKAKIKKLEEEKLKLKNKSELSPEKEKEINDKIAKEQRTLDNYENIGDNPDVVKSLGYKGDKKEDLKELERLNNSESSGNYIKKQATIDEKSGVSSKKIEEKYGLVKNEDGNYVTDGKTRIFEEMYKTQLLKTGKSQLLESDSVADLESRLKTMTQDLGGSKLGERIAQSIKESLLKQQIFDNKDVLKQSLSSLGAGIQTASNEEIKEVFKNLAKQKELANPLFADHIGKTPINKELQTLVEEVKQLNKKQQADNDMIAKSLKENGVNVTLGNETINKTNSTNQSGNDGSVQFKELGKELTDTVNKSLSNIKLEGGQELKLSDIFAKDNTQMKEFAKILKSTEVSGDALKQSKKEMNEMLKELRNVSKTTEVKDNKIYSDQVNEKITKLETLIKLLKEDN